MSAPLLEVDGVSLAFGAAQALDDLSFAVQPGEIVALTGPDGAGKSAALNVISGASLPTRGDVRFEDRSILGLRPNEVIRRGIGRTFQSPRLFLNMTVLENVMAAAYVRTQAGVWQSILRTPDYRREEARIRQQAEAKLALFGPHLHAAHHDQPAAMLSYANRRRLEIARALATDPRLLLLDEPAAGLRPHETEDLADLLLDLRRRGGYAILLAERDPALLARVADRIIALDHGRKIAERAPARA